MYSQMPMVGIDEPGVSNGKKNHTAVVFVVVVVRFIPIKKTPSIKDQSNLLLCKQYFRFVLCAFIIWAM